MKRKTAVIGGGPGGMMAAYAAAETDDVTLFERNERLGKKLFLTGKGRCNITNARPMEEFLSQIPTNARFLYSAFAALTNQDLIALLEKNGLPVKVERGGRVFPESDKSSDVISTFERMLKKRGVRIRLNTQIFDIFTEDSRIAGVATSGGREPFDRVIIAAGGLSYPTTGSDGKGYTLLEKLGHSVGALHPSLIPLVARQTELCRGLSGLSLKNITLTLFESGKKRYEELGELLFTHFGVSGPLVLSASAHLSDYTFKDTKICLDLKPGLDAQKLHARLLRDFEENRAKQIQNVIPKLLPKALAEQVLLAAHVNGKKSVSEINKAERIQLVETIKCFELSIVGTRSINEAIITRGGVSVKEVNPATMESRKVSGLYIVGEMLDVDAYTGGYNLQIAFSTGYLAGISH